MPYVSNALLVLEDGSAFPGQSLGARGEFVGEVVFHTAMTGHQEILCDPAYAGQMIVFTCPHIGNVGVNAEDNESPRPQAGAVLARQITAVPSNWRAERPLAGWLGEHGVPALAGIDTRRLTLLLREQGTLRGALSTENLDADRLLAMARSAPQPGSLPLVDAVTPREVRPWTEPLPSAWDPAVSLQAPHDPAAGPPPHLVVVDCGTKEAILRHLVTLGARVTVAPAGLTADEILALGPDGVLISSGPGDPRAAAATVEAVRALLGRVPLFGIGLGMGVIGLAAGAGILRLPAGHHGCNHPVQNTASGKIEITAQNHSYAVDAASLEGLPLQVTHVNLTDGTVEGLRHTTLPAWGVQYLPEGSPGPHDALHLLGQFVAKVRLR